MRVLLVEDDLDVAANVGEYLESKGHEVAFAYDGRVGLAVFAEGNIDLVVLDLTLPGIDGLEVCRRVRAGSDAERPILMLTARDQLEEKVAGFEAGADDYLVKPFALAELLVRIEALHRRASGGLEGAPITAGDLTYDPGTHRLERAGQVLELHRIGVDLLVALMRAAPRVVSRAALEEQLWGQETPDRDLLRSHIYLVRQVVDRPFERPLIETVRGRGYRIASGTETP